MIKIYQNRNLSKHLFELLVSLEKKFDCIKKKHYKTPKPSFGLSQFLTNTDCISVLVYDTPTSIPGPLNFSETG